MNYAQREHECGDGSPEAALATAVLTDAVNAWKRNLRPLGAGPRHPGVDYGERNACTGHAIECQCRTCLRDWFTAHPEGVSGHLSFRLCAEASGVEPAVILERLAHDFRPLGDRV